MLTLSALAIAASVQVIPSCDWTNRGEDKYMGDVPSAVDTYTDIPLDIRSALKAKMQDPRGYDDIAHLTRDAHKSERWIYAPPTMMHFGDGRRVCAKLDISRWRADDRGERGLVYCVGGYCVIVYTVCRNVSRTAILGPVTPRPPSGPLVPEVPVAQLDPLPVDVPPQVTIPPLEVLPLPDEIPLGSFSWQSTPPPEDDRVPPPRTTAEQTFYELWARPLFWNSGAVPLRVFTYEQPVPVPPVVTQLPPVPGVVPPVTSIPAVPLPPTVVPEPKPSTGVPSGDDAPGQAQPIPEPSTYVLFALGILGITYMVRKGRK